MRIGGLEKLTLIDYPDHIAAIVFTSGCNFRCHFCYNPMLVWPNVSDDKNIEKGYPSISEESLFLFLQERVGKLDGVVVTGGEPTLHNDLPKFIKKIKALGYDIKLDSNGTNPEMLKKLITTKLIDYIAMDIKAPLAKYEAVVGVPVDFNKIKKSVTIIKTSGLPYEFRTTIVPGLLEKKDIAIMGKELIVGAEKWYLQKFKSDTELVNSQWRNQKSFTSKDMEEMASIGGEYSKLCVFRG